MSASDRDLGFRSPRRIRLTVACIYLDSYFKPDDQGVVRKAREILDGANIELALWPDNGQKYAFNTLGCQVVGLRTDSFNLRSQRAIENLGAKKDGVMRRVQARRDGSARDSVIYSILREEWRDVRRNLEARLARHRGPQGESR